MLSLTSPPPPPSRALAFDSPPRPPPSPALAFENDRRGEHSDDEGLPPPLPAALTVPPPPPLAPYPPTPASAGTVSVNSSTRSFGTRASCGAPAATPKILYPPGQGARPPRQRRQSGGGRGGKQGNTASCGLGHPSSMTARMGGGKTAAGGGGSCQQQTGKTAGRVRRWGRAALPTETATWGGGESVARQSALPGGGGAAEAKPTESMRLVRPSVPRENNATVGSA